MEGALKSAWLGLQQQDDRMLVQCIATASAVATICTPCCSTTAAVHGENAAELAGSLLFPDWSISVCYQWLKGATTIARERQLPEAPSPSTLRQCCSCKSPECPQGWALLLVRAEPPWRGLLKLPCCRLAREEERGEPSFPQGVAEEEEDPYDLREEGEEQGGPSCPQEVGEVAQGVLGVPSCLHSPW